MVWKATSLALGSIASRRHGRASNADSLHPEHLAHTACSMLGGNMHKDLWKHSTSTDRTWKMEDSAF